MIEKKVFFVNSGKEVSGENSIVVEEGVKWIGRELRAGSRGMRVEAPSIERISSRSK